MKIVCHDLHNKSAEPKDVLFSNSNKIEVCRKTPGGSQVNKNKLIFDCRVMSRNHAVIFFDDNKFYIRKEFIISNKDKSDIKVGPRFP